MTQRGLVPGALLLGLLMSTVWASVQDELESAARHEQIAFILVPDRGATDVDQAGDIIQQALIEVKSSTLIEPDRSDEENSGLVGKHRLAGAPGRCEFQEA